MTAAAARWATELAAWVIPAEILAQAPESPWGHAPAMFRAGPPAAAARSRATELALERLPTGGAALDVGCGGGAAAFALAPPAGRVLGVDESAGMLELFAATAAQRGVDAGTFLGRWPDVAANVPSADVVVCHNVFYNVADLPAFARALDAHTATRVVAELTTVHGMTRFGPLWQHFWGIERPSGPSAELAREVLVEAGLPAHLAAADATRPTPTTFDDPTARATSVAFVRRTLCLTADRDAEIDALLTPELTLSVQRAVIWWDRV